MAEKLEVAESYIKKGHPVQKVIKYASIANSTWYQKDKRVEEDGRHKNPGRPIPGFTINPDGSVIPDEMIISALVNYRSRKEFANGGGYQKLTHYLRRGYGYRVNPKKAYRLCREQNILLPLKKKRHKRRSKRCINRSITASFQMWQLDLKYGFVHGENRFFFILAIIDVYMRLIVNCHICLSCKGKDLVFILDKALKDFGIPNENQLIIRSDNGTQMTSNVFTEHVQNFEEDQVLHELIPPATPNKNAHIEAFNSILETEFIQPRYFMNYGQAYTETVDSMGFYNPDPTRIRPWNPT